MAATPDTDSAPESLGAMLARLRLSRGLSQLRLAELLCAAAGTPTVTRHEISRWEREVRVPGPFWLGWLAAVLEKPLPELEAAAAASPPGAAGSPAARLDPFTKIGDLLPALADTTSGDLPALAHAWLVSPAGPDSGPALQPESPTRPSTAGTADPDTGAVRLQALRRTDDLVGGADFAERTSAELHVAIHELRSRHAGRRHWRMLASWAQLAGWVHADAGDPPRATAAYRTGLRAATTAGDRLLAAHILGSVSHLYLTAGAAPDDALLLARTAYAGVRHYAPAQLRTLLHHRIAMAAAAAGERRAAHDALAAAERAAGRIRPDREPAWLYWLDTHEVTAMTGRCLAALGRPVRAEPLLAPGRVEVGPRTRALDAGWLARTYLDLGEVERACELAAGAWRDAVRAGSPRVARFLRQLHPQLQRRRDVPAVLGYERLVTAVSRYLPQPPGPPRPSAQRRRPAAAGGESP